MNKTGIEWTMGPNGEQGYTFNPVTGCEHRCSYCYGFDLSETRLSGIYPWGYEPTLWLDKFSKKPPKKPCKIFLGSMADVFGDWQWRLWSEDIEGEAYYPADKVRKMVLDYCKKYPQHTFILLTKNPKGMLDYVFPDNCWTGVTITKTEDLDRMHILSRVKCKTKFVSFEPILERLAFSEDDEKILKLCIDWAIIGTLKGLKKDDYNAIAIREAIDELISGIRLYDIPLFLKDSVFKIIPDMFRFREFPGEEVSFGKNVI
jgi:protein gp37